LANYILITISLAIPFQKNAPCLPTAGPLSASMRSLAAAAAPREGKVHPQSGRKYVANTNEKGGQFGRLSCHSMI